jgi:hypothetical protein
MNRADTQGGSLCDPVHAYTALRYLFWHLPELSDVKKDE